MSTRLRLSVILAFTLALVSTREATSQVLLAELLQPGSMIQCEDKWFMNFTYETQGPDMPSADKVLVQCITDVDGNHGLRFSGLWQDSLNDSFPQSAFLSYTVVTHGPSIIDNHLFGDPTVVPDATGATDGLALVFESVFDPIFAELGTKTIFDSVADAIHDTRLVDWAHFSPQRSVLVEKTLFFQNLGGIPRLTFVDQTFSQVPEPGAVAILLSMGVGAAFFTFRLRCR